VKLKKVCELLDPHVQLEIQRMHPDYFLARREEIQRPSHQSSIVVDVASKLNIADLLQRVRVS
jgi:hypothetical protein